MSFAPDPQEVRRPFRAQTRDLYFSQGSLAPGCASRMCLTRFTLNALPQCSHTYGFSPEWTRLCFFRWHIVWNALPHVSQTCGFSPECVRMCVAKLSDRANALPHVSHSKQRYVRSLPAAPTADARPPAEALAAGARPPAPGSCASVAHTAQRLNPTPCLPHRVQLSALAAAAIFSDFRDKFSHHLDHPFDHPFWPSI